MSDETEAPSVMQRRAAFLADISEMRKNGLRVDQARVDTLADEYGLPRELLTEPRVTCTVELDRERCEDLAQRARAGGTVRVSFTLPPLPPGEPTVGYRVMLTGPGLGHMPLPAQENILRNGRVAELPAGDAVLLVAAGLASADGWTLEGRAESGCRLAAMHVRLAAEAGRARAGKPPLPASDRASFLALVARVGDRPHDETAARLMHVLRLGLGICDASAPRALAVAS